MKLDGDLTLKRFEAELQFLQEFAKENDFQYEIAKNQLRCLWTTCCLHYGWEVDTASYDNALLELWNIITERETKQTAWSDYDSFNGYMCVCLV